MEMKDAGAHRLTYRNYRGEHKTELVTHVSTHSSKWVDLTKVKIPVGKVAFVQCPQCRGDNWTDDAPHLKGYSCGSCDYEILLHTDEQLIDKDK